jgi:hypothetical protein
MRLRLLFAWVALLAATVPAGAQSTPGRRIAIVIDTSGSMARGNDEGRYTIQLSKILGDLVGNSDELAVFPMPNFGPNQPEESGLARIDRSLMIRLDPNNRAVFKNVLERIPYETSTAMLTPVLTATDWLSQVSNRPRLLLIMTDAQMFDCCDGQIAAELTRAQRAGVMIAGVGVGNDVNMQTLFGGVNLFARQTARNADELIASVAQIYQGFLGGRRPGRGPVRGSVRVDIDPFVREAFVVIAQDGPVPVPVVGAANPGAASIDRDFRGGHETRDVAGFRTRGYRIVRFDRPKPGSWTIDVPSLATGGSYLLIQDYSLNLRAASRGAAFTGTTVPVEIEVIDELTGQRVTDPAALRSLNVTADLGGRQVTLKDDGTGGDKVANDGVFTAEQQFTTPGTQSITARISSPTMDRLVQFPLDVRRGGGVLRPERPLEANAGDAVNLRVRLDAADASAPVPDTLTAQTPTGPVELKRVAGGGPPVFEAQWMPKGSGRQRIRIEGDAKSAIPALDLEAIIHGSLRWASPTPIVLDRLVRISQVDGVFDFSSAQVGGVVTVDVTSDLDLSDTRFVIDDGQERVLGSTPQRMEITEGGAQRWTVRLQSFDCPEACDPSTKHYLQLSVLRANNQRDVIRVPIVATVIAPAWYVCWRDEIGLLVLLLTGAFIVAGVYLPSRFRRGVGVQVSNTLRIDDGVLYLIRAVRGSRSRFYKDARVFLTMDYRVTGKPRGAVARFRADKQTIMMRPEAGARLFRRATGTKWEPVEEGEIPMEPGVLYRAGESQLYFEFRAQ